MQKLVHAAWKLQFKRQVGLHLLCCRHCHTDTTLISLWCHYNNHVVKWQRVELSLSGSNSPKRLAWCLQYISNKALPKRMKRNIQRLHSSSAKRKMTECFFVMVFHDVIFDSKQQPQRRVPPREQRRIHGDTPHNRFAYARGPINVVTYGIKLSLLLSLSSGLVIRAKYLPQHRLYPGIYLRWPLSLPVDRHIYSTISRM